MPLMCCDSPAKSACITCADIQVLGNKKYTRFVVRTLFVGVGYSVM